jgi:hypothetical protein
LAEETGAHVRDLDEFVRGHLTAPDTYDITISGGAMALSEFEARQTKYFRPTMGPTDVYSPARSSYQPQASMCLRALKFSAEEDERTFWIGCSNFTTSLRLDDRGGAAACWRSPP